MPDLPRPSQMDPWAIDFVVGGLIVYAGYSIRLGMASLNRTLTRIETDLRDFSELFRNRYEDLDHRLTRVEASCDRHREED